MIRATQLSQTQTTIGGRDCLALELAAADGARGRAYAPASAGLRQAVDALAARSASSSISATGLRARGLIESAHADVLCQRHGVSLHQWLGGPVRREVAVAWPIVVAGWSEDGASVAAAAAAGLDRELAHAQEAARTLGVTSFVIRSQATSVESVAGAVTTIRATLGEDAALSLRLTGQFDEAAARTLFERVAPANLISISDPCASLGATIDASHGRLPGLALSAASYDRKQLLGLLSAAPPTVLVIDPLLEGGPQAVRHLASIARVVQCDVSLTAEVGGTWLTDLCIELAAALPACHQPIELPAGTTIDELRARSVQHGKIKPAIAATGMLSTQADSR